MNKIFLVIQREFMSRVKKKSFLLATILVPLIFPAVIGVMYYLRNESEKNKKQEVIHILNKSDIIKFEDSERYQYLKVDGPLDSAKQRFNESEDFALIYLPEMTIEDPSGVVFYAKTTPGITLVRGFERQIENQIRDMKLTQAGLTNDQLDQLKTDVSIASFNLTETGDESKSSAKSTFWISYVMGFLIYIFLFAYGSQVMQGVIEEKSSKIVEVIVSTVRPFQMMLGKVVGVASVGIVQLLIWVILMSAVWIGLVSMFGVTPPQAEGLNQANSAEAQNAMQDVLETFGDVNWMPIIALFIFYFLGGYLLYGALFAAVGSAVDTPADAQQFMMPIMLPIIISLMGLFMFVFEEPNGTASFWLSIIPFTSPIVMMGRIGFGVPAWEIALSMVMLIAGFIFTLWLAGRIYRIGILMHGTKVNYKVLAKWLMQKN
ncbi:ABC transporter permease [Ekhidna sp. To15]|uniref:ABC transporter permease n=1 Tax=Ekhidna sp. To15 TaxID=3395267 RepID=UPI003F523812